jgi:uncharacterized delta-60 repeat protein
VFSASAFAACLITGATSAIGGDLDPAFSGDGKVRTTLTSHGDFGTSVAVQSDGKIVVVGAASWNTRDTKFGIVRYNADGTPDSSFGGGDGKATTNFTPRVDAAWGVAIQTGGEIVVVGDAGLRTGDSKFAVARYLPDGTLDSTFGGDGKVMTQFTKRDESVSSVALQGDGKIVVAGAARADIQDSRIAVARYNPDGTLDSTFSGDGKVTAQVSDGRDFANAVTVQPDERIVVGGLAAPGSWARMAVLRYLSDGTLDSTFSGDGKVLTGLTRRHDSVQSLMIDSADNIVAAGIAGSGGSDARFGVVRYTPSGGLDPSFSGDGKVTANITGGYDAAWDAVQQSDGKIVLGGIASGGGYRFALARFATDGSLDTTFSGDGKVVTNFTPKSDFAYGVAVQTDDAVILAGGAGWGGSTPGFAVARYLPN